MLIGHLDVVVVVDNNLLLTQEERKGEIVVACLNHLHSYISI